MNDPKTIAISKAKLDLMTKKNSVFISTVLFSLIQDWEDSIPTADVDGVTLRINPDWFMKLSRGERVGLVAHEAWHVAFNHITRATDAKLDHKKYNRAADYVINIMLQDSGYCLPPKALVDTRYRGMSTEQVYAKLGDDPDYKPDIKPNGELGSEELTNKIDEILVKAKTQADISGDSAGSMPSDIQIYIDKLLNPKLDGKTLLHKYFTDFAKTDYSYKRPNRRFAPDFYLPSLKGKAMGELATAVDSSGSVMDHEFTAFLSEIDGFKRAVQPTLTTIIDFDTRINNVHKLKAHDDVRHIKFTGRGGTNLKPVFEYYKKKKPNILVVFSDLECAPIKEDPGYPVLWICVGNPRAKVNFGTLIHYKT